MTDLEEHRKEGSSEHEVIDLIERDHHMNGKICEHPWAVIQWRPTGSISFYCGECRVDIGAGPDYEELMDIWGGSQTVNTNARAYPSTQNHHLVKSGVQNDDVVQRIPPDRL